jgi:hypothetical protein
LINDAMVFIDENGYIYYFAQVTKDKANIALKITSDGKVNIYSKIP